MGLGTEIKHAVATPPSPLPPPLPTLPEDKEIYPSADIYAFGEYGEGYSRSQLKFDISSIPPGSSIVSAKLWMYRLVAGNWDGNIALYRVENQVWGEDITENEFDAQTLTDGENHAGKFMSHGWDYLNMLTQLKVDHKAGNPYTSFRLRWADDNGGEPSIGIDDSPLLAIESGYDNLHIVFYSSELNGGEPYLEVTYIQPYGISVSISPSDNSGLPAQTLNYTVTVANTGTLDDNYDLTVSDTWGWGDNILLDNTLLVIPENENRTTTLHVTIPENAIGCTSNVITVTATSQGNDNVSDNASCIAHVTIVRGVEVLISPDYQDGPLGETLNYTVTIVNMGNVTDSYTLSASDAENWGPELSENQFDNVPPFEDNEKETTLSVTIPENAVPCTEDNITVTAISQIDNTTENSASCIAHAVISPPQLPTQPQLSSPSNGSEVTTNTPTLRWENAMYAENHRVLLDDDSNPDDNPLYDHTVKEDDEWTTPTLIEDETYYWKVIAQNENGKNHSVTWQFTVNAEGPAPPPPTNKPPTADADGPYSVQENGTVELNGTGSTDPDGDPLTYYWTIVDDPIGGASLTADDTATPVFHAPEHIDNAVDVTVKLSVNDGHGHTDSDTATVKIQPAGVNLPPTADAGGPYSVQENGTIELDGTGSSDPDGTIVTYSWTITDDPTGEAFLINSDTATPIFHAPSVKSDMDVTVGLTVEDDDDATDTDTATVTVRVAGEGLPQYELSTSVSPPEGGTVTLDPPGGTYEEGTEVTATAVPADNYEFDHWSGDASGTSTSVTITMDSDKIVTAHFRSISEKGRGLPLIQLGLGILMLIIIFTIFAMLATRRRRSTRSPAKSSKPLLRKTLALVALAISHNDI
ncbi:MAG: PKD domain-containing protein [Candidatus Hadarchaeota archaeon]|nr:PKD domain-containing protein [Candidatus Hadarchaeota archaeon]